MDEETRRLVCRLIAGIVVVDDHLARKEDRFLDRLLSRFQFPVDERGFCFPIMDGEEAASALRGLPSAVQEETLALLIEAAAADKEYAEEERDYLHTVGKVIGVTAAEIDERVDATIRDT
jgi:uncharacterized tellurite resistance protein B-like protein